MKRVDFEFHYYHSEALEYLGKWRGTYPWYDAAQKKMFWSKNIGEPQAKLLPGLLMTDDERIEYMDKSRIDVCVLSSAPGVDELGADSVELCRKINDDVYRATKKYPGRIYGSAILPVHDVAESCRELERCVKDLGFVGWHAHSVFLNRGLDEDMYIPLFKLAEKLGVYVYIHPRCSFWNRLEGFDFNLPGSGFGFTVETQTTVIKMMLKGYFDMFPNLTVMLGHYAEGLPFYLDRMQSRLHLHPVETIKMEKDVKHYFNHNIIATTSGNMSGAAFRCCKEVMGIDRMLIGADTPFEKASEMMDFLDSMDLTEEERAKLYYLNAEKYLPKI